MSIFGHCLALLATLCVFLSLTHRVWTTTGVWALCQALHGWKSARSSINTRTTVSQLSAASRSSLSLARHISFSGACREQGGLSAGRYCSDARGALSQETHSCACVQCHPAGSVCLSLATLIVHGTTKRATPHCASSSAPVRVHCTIDSDCTFKSDVRRTKDFGALRVETKACEQVRHGHFGEQEGI